MWTFIFDNMKLYVAIWSQSL